MYIHFIIVICRKLLILSMAVYADNKVTSNCQVISQILVLLQGYFVCWRITNILLRKEINGDKSKPVFFGQKHVDEHMVF